MESSALASADLRLTATVLQLAVSQSVAAPPQRRATRSVRPPGLCSAVLGRWSHAVRRLSDPFPKGVRAGLVGIVVDVVLLAREESLRQRDRPCGMGDERVRTMPTIKQLEIGRAHV